MRNLVQLCSMAAVAAAFWVGSARADDDLLPSKVTGGGKYQQLEGWPTMDVAGDFSLTINPDRAPGKKSPQATIHFDGPVLREVWGGRLVIQGDYDGWDTEDFGNPDDPKPGQYFIFDRWHPDLDWVRVFVFTHDNVTPGYNALDPNWSDWVLLMIEPLDGDGEPFTGDELYLTVGIVVSGNVMDHRK